MWACGIFDQRPVEGDVGPGEPEIPSDRSARGHGPSRTQGDRQPGRLGPTKRGAHGRRWLTGTPDERAVDVEDKQARTNWAGAVHEPPLRSRMQVSHGLVDACEHVAEVAAG